MKIRTIYPAIFMCVSILVTTCISLTAAQTAPAPEKQKIEALIEGRPEVLIHNGRLFTEVMEREKLTHHELNAALRAAGCACVEEVRFAILENNGVINVQTKTERGAGKS